MIPPDEDTVRIGFPTVARHGRSSVSASRSSPAESLRSVVGLLLDDGPCFVAFSGGCDSSLILGVATEVCRATGHADPIPVTYRFSHAPATDESDYQELVVRHLRLHDWLVIDLHLDGDLLGGPATTALRRHGPVWPPAAFAQVAALEQLDEGLFLTGEGGDELLGWRRITPIARAAQRARRGHAPSRPLSRVALQSLAPWPMRETLLGRRLDRNYGAAWLSTDVRRDLLRKIARLDASEPLRARPYSEYALNLPARQIGHHNLRAVHARFGLRWQAPLYDLTFLGSLAGLRWHDYQGRTEFLRRHFHDLLPVEIIERRTKAVFNGAYMGRSTRAFAQRWNGEGVPEGVDAEWLKDHWSNATDIDVGTTTLLHRAWLATEGAVRSEPTSSAATPDRASE